MYYSIRKKERDRIFYLSSKDNKIYEVELISQIPSHSVVHVLARNPADANRMINRRMNKKAGQ